MQYFTTFVIYSFWVRLKNFSIHILMKLVAYNVNCISFLIAVHSTLCLNPQNFYFMNDVLFFCMYLQILLNVCFIYMSSWLYVPSFVYIPPYIVATSTFLRFRNETLHFMTRYQLHLNQDRLVVRKSWYI